MPKTTPSTRETKAAADITAAIEQYEADVLRSASCCAILGCIRVKPIEPGKAIAAKIKASGMNRFASDESDDEDGPGAAASKGSKGDDEASRDVTGGSPARADSLDDETSSKDSDESEQVKPVPFCELFRFATSYDWFLITVGLLCGAAVGAVQPLFAILFGGLIDSFSAASISDAISQISVYLVAIGIGAGLGFLGQYSLLGLAAERMTFAMRRAYVEALLRQPQSAWDDLEPGTVTARLADDSLTFSRGVGEQLGMGMQALAAMIGGLIVGFYYNWLLALIVAAWIIPMALPISVMFASRTSFQTITSDAFARASAVSSEALSSIRTVTAFGSEQAESRRFNRHVGLAERVISGSGIVLGVAQGLFWVFIMGAYASSMAAASSFIVEARKANPLCYNGYLVTSNAAGTEDCFSPGDALLVFFATLTGAFTAGQLGPAISAVASARISLRPFLDVIDAPSEIDPLATAPAVSDPAAPGPAALSRAPPCPAPKEGIHFVDVSFHYPSSRGVWVLKGFNLHVPKGSTVALVGASGCGKSTALALLLRFYDPQEGAIYLDGVDIRSLPVRDLRARLGYVPQSPRLFDTSVAENVALGIPEYESDYGDNSTSGFPTLSSKHAARVREALQAASALSFVEKLPSGLDTMVGAKGATLSGGQRQRVCIARAVVRRPEVLVLDEATSALDTRSEAEVQAAIDKLLAGEVDAPRGGSMPSSSLTALVIAHRLATIRGADKIVVVHDGMVEDAGTHTELVDKAGGRYAAMHATQDLGTAGTDSSATAADAATAAESEAVTVEENAADELASASRGDEGIGKDQGTTAKSTPSPSAQPDTADEGSAGEKGTLVHSPEAIKLAFLETPILRAIHDRLVLEGSDASEPVVPLTKGSAEVLALFHALHEMTEDERQAALEWWLGSRYDGTKGSEAEALDASSGWAPTITPPSKAMVEQARKDDLQLEDLPPQADAKTATLRLTPVKGRNRMLAMVLIASVPTVSFWQVFDYQRPEWPFFVLGTIGCAIAGSVFPVQSVVFAFILDALYGVDDDKLMQDAGFAAAMFMLVGGVAFIGFVLQYGSFEYIGAKLTSRMRKHVYGAVLRQDMAFHDYPSNSVGRLTARLATDAALVRRSTGERLGLVVQSGTGLIVGLAIAFEASWQLTLVILGLVPFMAALAVVLAWAFNNTTSLVKEALEGTTATAYEAAANIRTVAALGIERHVLGDVQRSLEAPRSAAVRIAVTNGIAQGVLQFMLFGAYGLVFWVGALFIEQGILNTEGLFRTFFVLAFVSLSSATATEFAGDQSKAESAKNAAFALFRRKSKIDPESEEGVVPESFRGEIEFRNVWFAYPARPEVWALKDLSFTIPAGSTVGVCGESGSGKSTVIQLLLRFFDPQKGQVLLDGRNIRELNVGWLRAKMGLVQQQPELFSDTIMYNILYGNVPKASKPDAEDVPPSDKVAAAEEGRVEQPGLVGNKPLAELGLGTRPDGEDHPDAVEAAKQSLAHRFIVRKPFQYASPAGAAGTPALSGGQGQRVAIARALIRQEADIFLADEATAALDSVSERKVQQALERAVEISRAAGKERTSIVIAHRLSTIKDSTKILVLDRGALVEEGTHHELISTPSSLYRDMAVKQDGAAAVE